MVPIYYESRLAKLTLDEDEKPSIDPDFEEATGGEDIERKDLKPSGPIWRPWSGPKSASSRLPKTSRATSGRAWKPWMAKL